jgi:hypothetical protein
MRSVRYCLLLSVLLFAVSVAYGQQGRTRVGVEFRKFEFNNVPTPVYKPTTHSGATREYDWLQVYAEYSAAGGEKGWIDELQFNWSVLVKQENGRYLLFHAQATYQDIETQANQHRVAVYIRPAIARRYCGKNRIPKSDIWVHVEVSSEGRVVAKEDYSRSRSPGANWWKTGDTRGVQVMEGALLTRDKTPFAPLDYDFYEHLKGTPAR